MSIESVMPSNHLILCCPLLLLLSILASRSFPMSRLFTSGGQSIGISASASAMNIQDWFLLHWQVWSSCCPRDPQESSPTPQFKSINSLALSFLYCPTLTSIHDSWKNHCSGYIDLCQKSDVSFKYAVQVWHSFSSKRQVSFNFMDAVTIHSDSETQENKICHSFHFSPHLFAMKWWDQTPWS